MEVTANISQAINDTTNIQQTIAIKVLKDTLQQQQEMINQLISNSPVSVNPKSNNSTFEFIV
jgi:hypothetical protein